LTNNDVLDKISTFWVDACKYSEILWFTCNQLNISNAQVLEINGNNAYQVTILTELIDEEFQKNYSMTVTYIKVDGDFWRILTLSDFETNEQNEKLFNTLLKSFIVK